MSDLAEKIEQADSSMAQNRGSAVFGEKKKNEETAVTKVAKDRYVPGV